MKQKITFFAVLAVMLLFGSTAFAAKKPNIVVIWGDDIGITNVSAYSKGLMGYQTPNIDRVAKEGMMFTDFYAENSCTARPLRWRPIFWFKTLI
jgi:arylsulfatase